MKNSLVKAIVIGSIIHVTAVTTSGAEGRWSRVAPQRRRLLNRGAGRASAGGRSGQYVYTSGLWFLQVKLLAVDPMTRELVERRERKALVQCLESVRDSMVGAATATQGGSSSGDIDGYPSLRFSLATAELEGTNLLVVTGEHLYLVMTVGPKGIVERRRKALRQKLHVVTTDHGPVVDSRVPNVPPADSDSLPGWRGRCWRCRA